MQHSWYTTPADVKQLIVSAADPQTARSLCQLDDEARRVCRDYVPAQQKYRICLGGGEAAAECDGIPMFSERQFVALVPQRIEIYTEDPVQMTHQFYSQTYKLSGEGFAVSLRKAKLMNTICAAVRPEFLLTSEAALLPLPAYVDTTVLDTVIREYVKFLGTPDPKAVLAIVVTLNHNVEKDARIKLLVYHTVYDQHHDLYKAELYANEIFQRDVEVFINKLNRDEYIPFNFRTSITMRKFGDRYIIPRSTLAFPKGLIPINVFHISRLLKIAFDMGYYYTPIFSLIDDKDAEIMRVEL